MRLAWILLAVLGGYESYYLFGLGVTSLIALPLIAGVVDLVFQMVRFPRLRFPDAALVTGLFLAVIFPPTAPILLAGACTFAAVGLRHALRSQGRPWLNPAATGVVVGAVLLGLAPAWWVGIGPFGELLMLALGALLLVRSPSSWRLPVIFLLTYGILAVVQHVVVGATTDPRILFLQVADPSTLFFALFLMPEPRTAPGASHLKVLYAGTVGISAAFLPLFLPSLGLFAALLGGNLLAVVLRRRPHVATDRASAATRPQSGRARRAAALAARPTRRAPNRWPVTYRVTAGILVLVVLVAVVGLTPVSPSFAPIVKVTPPGGGGGVTSACRTDNPSIPTSELSALHKLLGPSVILSYDSSTGVVRFYDPVNQVTVVESDLYEDYGFAEFNGDDYAVSGCSP
ncbi:MAG: RnfABCDGE type electron transport complex subunit D [Thermoplasmata archaeon]